MDEDTRVERPAPLTPAECDLRGVRCIPLAIEELRRSEEWLRAEARPELGFYAVNLWMAAWHELPAGSLPHDDLVLMMLARCARQRWHLVGGQVLHSWTLCSDGRLYHPALAVHVQAAWRIVVANHQKTRAAQAAWVKKAARARAERLRCVS